MGLTQAIAEGRSAVSSLRSLTAYAKEVEDVDQRGQLMSIIGELSLQIADNQLSMLEEFLKNPDIEAIRAILID